MKGGRQKEKNEKCWIQWFCLRTSCARSIGWAHRGGEETALLSESLSSTWGEDATQTTEVWCRSHQWLHEPCKAKCKFLLAHSKRTQRQVWSFSWANRVLSKDSKDYYLLWCWVLPNFLFLIQDLYIAQVGLELEILLPRSPQCWDYRCVLT
jgi:hypothetical protein